MIKQDSLFVNIDEVADAARIRLEEDEISAGAKASLEKIEAIILRLENSLSVKL